MKDLSTHEIAVTVFFAKILLKTFRYEFNEHSSDVIIYAINKVCGVCSKEQLLIAKMALAQDLKGRTLEKLLLNHEEVKDMYSLDEVYEKVIKHPCFNEVYINLMEEFDKAENKINKNVTERMSF